MMKELRKIDRAVNTYPDLNFPEIYLLSGGYINFYEKYGNAKNTKVSQKTDEAVFDKLFNKCGYIKMVDERFAEDLKNFTRYKSKSLSYCNSQKDNIRSLKGVRPPLRSLSKGSSRRLF